MESRLSKNMMIGEILVKKLTCLLISPLFLICWRGMINLIYLFIDDSIMYIGIHIRIYVRMDIIIIIIIIFIRRK